MVFSDQTYSVLVVSAAQKFNEAFAAMLPGSEYYPVRFVGNIAAARTGDGRTRPTILSSSTLPCPTTSAPASPSTPATSPAPCALLLAKSDAAR